MANEQQDKAPNDVQPDDLISGGRDEQDPVAKAYARTGRPDSTGVNGIPASDEDAGDCSAFQMR